MHTTHDIKNLLDIQDPNITFSDACVEIKQDRGKVCKFISATLTYTPTHCAVCGMKNEHFSVIKNGTQTSRITLPLTGMHRTFLLLKKQRFFCKRCSCTFVARSSIVDRHCFISNQTKACVTMKATEAQSITLIAQDAMISVSSVQRFIQAYANECLKPTNRLPENLSFDEFKYARGRMAFQYIDAQTGTILDILPSRFSYHIKNHFYTRYSYRERCSVKTITIDMNAGYEKLIQELFPKAKIIIDRFHLVQLISRSMNQLRIQVMNGFRRGHNEDQKKYRRLKRYWKLLLKNEKDLTYTVYKPFGLFGQTTDRTVVDTLLSYDERLQVNYTLYQSLLNAMKDKDINVLQTLLKQPLHEEISLDFRRSMRTLKHHLSSIENSFMYPFNNGRIEGIHNKIKVLNRVAYGYRNFTNYRQRIFIHFKLKRASCVS